MASIQQEEIPCPFCGVGKISCDHIPSVLQEKRHVTKAFGTRTEKKLSCAIWEVKSDCPNCGKTTDDIKKAMKEGAPPDKEKLKSRYNELQKLKEELKRERNQLL